MITRIELQAMVDNYLLNVVENFLVEQARKGIFGGTLHAPNIPAAVAQRVGVTLTGMGWTVVHDADAGTYTFS